MKTLGLELRRLVWEGGCYPVPKDFFEAICDQAGYVITKDEENFEIHVISEEELKETESDG